MGSTDTFLAATPLTARGQPHELPPETQDKVCFLTDGRLLVCKAHRNHPDVESFIGRLVLKRVTHEVICVEYADIRQAYSDPSQAVNPDSAIQGFATRMFAKAASAGASDIHLRVNEKETVILFRIHGDLLPHETHPAAYGKLLLSAIFTAMTDVSAKSYLPLSAQDARISDPLKLPPALQGIRIGTTPQVGGEVMVLRLLYDDSHRLPDLRALGFTSNQTSLLQQACHTPIGINLVCGPTGSGKSTTLHQVLSIIMTACNRQKNLMTVEDPPEYRIGGAVQTPVTNATTAIERNAAFTNAIIAALRCDPDLLMIGEMRDPSSAIAAFRAAMTGHQVWSTVHTNGVFQTFARLIDLDIPPGMLFDHQILTSITAQRLIKRLCPRCKVPLKSKPGMTIGNPDFERVSAATQGVALFGTGFGCQHCTNGIAGRQVVAEVLLTDRPIMRLLSDGHREGNYEAAFDYWRKALDGKTLMDQAIDTVKQGIADPFTTEATIGQFPHH